MLTLEQTWDPSLKSFIESAQGSSFPIQHLPLGVFKPKMDGNYRIGTRIGDYIIDLSKLDDYGFFDEFDWSRKNIFNRLHLNKFMSNGRKASRELRCKLAYLLSNDVDVLKENDELRQSALYKAYECTLNLPVRIGDYTDFYSSKEHATNVGIMFRGKDNALQPNWLHLPVGYHGRASSVVKSGTEIKRPSGQTKSDDKENPTFNESRLMDFELEMGFFLSSNNELGNTIPVDQAEEHIWGMVIVNDWSARDIQKWEYVPLGPFLAKNFATSISPWVVTMEALEPFRVQAPNQDPQPLPYLDEKDHSSFDIKLEVDLKTTEMDDYYTITKSNFKYLYWTMAQQLAHHASSGCNMQVGDLLASGTISGPKEGMYGSLLEITWRGSKPITLPNGKERKFLQDGDSIRMRAVCSNEYYSISFGEVEGTIA